MLAEGRRIVHVNARHRGGQVLVRKSREILFQILQDAEEDKKLSGERKASKSKKRHFARASSAKPHEINYFIELAARSLAATLQSRHMYAPNPRSLEFLSRSSDN